MLEHHGALQRFQDRRYFSPCAEISAVSVSLLPAPTPQKYTQSTLSYPCEELALLSLLQPQHLGLTSHLNDQSLTRCWMLLTLWERWSFK